MEEQSASASHRSLTLQQVYEERIRLATLLRKHAKQAKTELYRIRPDIDEHPAWHAVERLFYLALLETRIWKKVAKWMLQAFDGSRPASAIAHFTLAQRWKPLMESSFDWHKSIPERAEKMAANLRHAVHYVCAGLKQLPAALRRAVDEHDQKSQPKGPVCVDEAAGDIKSACLDDHPRVGAEEVRLSDNLFAHLQTSRGESLVSLIKCMAEAGNHGDEPLFVTLGRYCPDPVVQRRALRALVDHCLKQDRFAEEVRLEELDRLAVRANARSLTPEQAMKKIEAILWTFGDDVTDRDPDTPQEVEMAEITIAVPEVIPVLLKAYQSNAHLRTPIGEALRQSREGCEAVEADFRAFLQSPDAHLRKHALGWLHLTDRLTPDLLPHCIEICREASPDEDLVWSALLELGIEQPETVVAGLLPALTTGNGEYLDEVGGFCANVVALGSSPIQTRMLAEITKMLAHPKAGVRATGVAAVSDLEDHQAAFRSTIEALRSDMDPQVAQRAAELVSRVWPA
jgi:hypothetical protein